MYLLNNIFGEFGSVLLIILFIVAFVKISNLKKRVSFLESQQAQNNNATNAAQVQVEADLVNPTLDINTANNEVFTKEFYEDNTASNAFADWLKEDWMLKLGGLLLLIGLGWFTTYAFMNNWIGEIGQITLGILLGVIVLAFGTWRIAKYLNQGGVFLVIGSAIILLTIFAGREIYPDMFPPIFALIVMFFSAAYIALISVKYDSFAVSLSGLVLAFIAPLLTNSQSADEITLFFYLLVIVLGAIWIVAIKKNWGALIFASLVGVLLYSIKISLFAISFDPNGDVLIWFAYGFAAIFFLASIINIINSREDDIKSFLWTAVGNGALLLFWIMGEVSTEWQSSVIALWMLIFAIGAFISFSVTKIKSVFFVYAGVALAMLIVATTIELDGAALTVAYTLESLLIPILIYFTTKDVRASTIGSLLIIAPAFLSLSNLDSYYRSESVLSKDFFAIFLVIIAIMSLGYMFKKIKDINTYYNIYPDNIYLIVGSVYAYILLWSALHVGMSDRVAATTLSLVIFTIIALIKYFYGISVGSKTLRNYGAALLGVVILRLVFIDIWDMEIGARIFVFILIGVLLMSTAFYSRRITSGFTDDTKNQIKS